MAEQVTPRRPPLSPVLWVGAFVAVVLAGLSGAAIGSSLVEFTCEGDCGALRGAGAVVGAILGAGGVAVVAVLVLRAVAEYHHGGFRRPRA